MQMDLEIHMKLFEIKHIETEMEIIWKLAEMKLKFPEMVWNSLKK